MVSQDYRCVTSAAPTVQLSTSAIGKLHGSRHREYKLPAIVLERTSRCCYKCISASVSKSPITPLDHTVLSRHSAVMQFLLKNIDGYRMSRR